MADVFAGLNSACLNAFGEEVVYTVSATGAEKSVTGVPEMDGDEEQHRDSLYVRFFFSKTDLGVVPDHGDLVSVPSDASPLNLMGGPRALALGSNWVVYETLVDPAGGVYVRLRREV